MSGVFFIQPQGGSILGRHKARGGLLGAQPVWRHFNHGFLTSMKHGLCIVLVDWVMVVVVRSPSVALFRHEVQKFGEGLMRLIWTRDAAICRVIGNMQL
jgi:hypothetical protein